jgi:hypothetical protein
MPSKRIGTRTLPAFFMLAERRTSLFNAMEASPSSLPISATGPPGPSETAAAGVWPPMGDTPGICASADG